MGFLCVDCCDSHWQGVTASVVMAVNPHYQTFFEEHFADSDSEAEFEGFEEQDNVENDPVPVFDPDFTLEWSADVQLPDPIPFTGTPGIQFNLPQQPSPGDIFTYFFSHEELTHIAVEMNRYIAQVKTAKADHFASHPHARLNSWEDTTPAELRRFLAIILYMGIVVHDDITRYWSTDPLLVNPFVPSLMTKNR